MDSNLAKIRHERSIKDFPFLTLEDDEYVEYSFRRAKICLNLILGGTACGLIMVLLFFLVALMYQSTLDEMGKHFLFILLASLLAAAVLIGLIAVLIYRGNRLFVTNKHVIQIIMTSPFATSINIIDLIESTKFNPFEEDSEVETI